MGTYKGKTLYLGSHGYILIIHGWAQEELFHRFLFRTKTKEDIVGKVVHHLDGNKLNNRMNNLSLMRDETQHRQLHARVRLAARGYCSETHKYCPKCDTVHEKGAFGKSRQTYDGLYGFCKKCACAWQKANLEKNKDKINKRRRERYAKKNLLG